MTAIMRLTTPSSREREDERAKISMKRTVVFSLSFVLSPLSLRVSGVEGARRREV
jgi:hypothetical protein